MVAVDDPIVAVLLVVEDTLEKQRLYVLPVNLQL